MSNLPVLPDIDFINTNPQEIIDMIIDGYETAAGVTLAAGDPRRLFLLSIAAVIIRQRLQIDIAGKNNTLYYATGDYLDHIGAMRATERIPASGALATVKFSLSSIQRQVVNIPKGTRVTADGVVYWQTTVDSHIKIGDRSVDVIVESMSPGSHLNGIEVGIINQLVDPIPYVNDVKNITETNGGADKEGDESYRERIYRAPAAFSIAGPRLAYEYWAKSASSSIIDVVAHSPSPGVVKVIPLLDGGGIPGEEILSKVDGILSDDTIRPLSDKVEVDAPIGVNYNIDITYYIKNSDLVLQADIDERIKKAVSDFVLWQKSKIGRDINPDELIRRLIIAGAKRVNIVSPVFKKIEFNEIAQDVDIDIKYGGSEDE